MAGNRTATKAPAKVTKNAKSEGVAAPRKPRRADTSAVESFRAPLGELTAGSASKALAGGRITQSGEGGLNFGLTTMLPPLDAESHWRIIDLDVHALNKINPMKLLELLADMAPDLSRALWDFLRMCNPGHETEVKRPGADTEDEAAKADLEAFYDQLTDYYGSIDVVWGRFFLSAFMRGAFWGELVLGLGAQEMADLVVLDPIWVRFKKERDPVRGVVHRMGQMQNGKFVDLSGFPTIRYLPIDPFVGNPYGRPIALPSLFTMLFLIGLMHDLRRVVAQQGYPRIDLSVNLERLKLMMPQNLAQDQKALREWTQAIVNEIVTAYKNLQPDDAYVHTDVIEVNRPVGTVDSDSLSAVDALIKALERQAVRALKTMPLLMGTTDGVSEANANRQWEIFAAGIKSLQHGLETMLSRLFSVGLQAMGHPVVVELRFAELRAAEMLRDAQTEAMRIENERAKYEAGWTSQDEGALEITGHEADQTEPRGGTGAPPPPVDPATVNPEPGADRKINLGGAEVRLPVGVGEQVFITALAESVADILGDRLAVNLAPQRAPNGKH